MSRFTRFFLASTALSPVLLVYAAIAVFDKNWINLAWSLGVFAFLFGLFFILIFWIPVYLQRQNYTADTVEVADKENLQFVLIYLLPIITQDFADQNWIALTIVAIFICLVVATGYGYHFNPILTFLGYHFYKVTEKNGLPHVLITRRRIYKTSEKLRVVSIMDYILIEEKIKA